MPETPPPRALRTERLTLRPFVPGDAADVARHAGDPRIADTLFELPRPYRESDASHWIASHDGAWRAGLRYAFATCRGDDGTLVGTIALRRDAPGAGPREPRLLDGAGALGARVRERGGPRRDRLRLRRARTRPDRGAPPDADPRVGPGDGKGRHGARGDARGLPCATRTRARWRT